MEAVVEFLKQWCGTYGYPVLFAGVLLENAGLPIPGETAVLVAGMLASDVGDRRFHIMAVIVVTALAAVLGDNLGFWLGRRWARPRLLAGRRFLLLTPRALRMAEAYFHHYGSWTIFFARFVTGLRVVGALAAGTAGMLWPRFLVANAAGAVMWATVISLLGYFFGENWRLLEHWVKRSGWLALAALLLFLSLLYLKGRLGRWLAAAAQQKPADREESNTANRQAPLSAPDAAREEAGR